MTFPAIPLILGSALDVPSPKLRGWPESLPPQQNLENPWIRRKSVDRANHRSKKLFLIRDASRRWPSFSKFYLAVLSGFSALREKKWRSVWSFHAREANCAFARGADYGRYGPWNLEIVRPVRKPLILKCRNHPFEPRNAVASRTARAGASRRSASGATGLGRSALWRARASASKRCRSNSSARWLARWALSKRRLAASPSAYRSASSMCRRIASASSA